MDIVVPILYFLNDARSDTCNFDLCPSFIGGILIDIYVSARIGLMHIGIFILLLLSGERNFGVRLNKPYATRVPMDISVFTGTHADLLIIVSSASVDPQRSSSVEVFHKIIVSAHQRLQPLYDCLLTIIVNISPYLKSLSMVSSNKLVHLFEVKRIITSNRGEERKIWLVFVLGLQFALVSARHSRSSPFSFFSSRSI